MGLLVTLLSPFYSHIDGCHSGCASGSARGGHTR